MVMIHRTHKYACGCTSTHHCYHGPGVTIEKVYTEDAAELTSTPLTSDLPGVKPFVWIAFAQQYGYDPVIVGVYADPIKATEKASGYIYDKPSDDQLNWSWWVSSKEVQS